MPTLSGRQCKLARSLLKWNIHDLANQLKAIPVKRVEGFEQGTLHLMKWENDDILRVFSGAHIEFGANLQVSLHGKTSGGPRKISGEGARIVIENDLSVISDSSTEQEKLADIFRKKKEREEEARAKAKEK